MIGVTFERQRNNTTHTHTHTQFLENVQTTTHIEHFSFCRLDLQTVYKPPNAAYVLFIGSLYYIVPISIDLL